MRRVRLRRTHGSPASPTSATGTPGNWWTVFALVPDAFDHAVAGFQFYRGQRKLDPKLRELGQTRAGWARASQFVFSQHCKASRSVGLLHIRPPRTPIDSILNRWPTSSPN